MAGKTADRLGERGRKFSLWVSAEDQRRLADSGLTLGEAFRRGLAATPDPVPVPEGLAASLELVSRLAQALAAGGKLVYPDET